MRVHRAFHVLVAVRFAGYQQRRGRAPWYISELFCSAGSQVGEVRLGFMIVWWKSSIRSCANAVVHVGEEAGPSGTSIVGGQEDPLCGRVWLVACRSGAEA